MDGLLLVHLRLVCYKNDKDVSNISVRDIDFSSVTGTGTSMQKLNSEK